MVSPLCTYVDLLKEFTDLGFIARNSRSPFPVSPFVLYSVAAFMAPCIVPYTLTVMNPTISAIGAKAKGKANAPSDSETKALLEKWRSQNLTRAYITGTAAVLGSAAMLL